MSIVIVIVISLDKKNKSNCQYNWFVANIVSKKYHEFLEKHSQQIISLVFRQWDHMFVSDIVKY